MIEDTALDTNILIYSIDSRDARKHAVAKRVVDRCSTIGCRIPLQALSEFCRATTKPGLLDATTALQILQEWRSSMIIIAPVTEDLFAAIALGRRYKLQLFDALLLSTATRAGCSTVLSEDMQHRQIYGGVQVINPFSLSPAELDTLLT